MEQRSVGALLVGRHANGQVEPDGYIRALPGQLDHCGEPVLPVEHVEACEAIATTLAASPVGHKRRRRHGSRLFLDILLAARRRDCHKRDLPKIVVFALFAQAGEILGHPLRDHVLRDAAIGAHREEPAAFESLEGAEPNVKVAAGALEHGRRVGDRGTRKHLKRSARLHHHA